MAKVNLKESLLQDLQNKMKWAIKNLEHADQWVEENPRSHKAKAQYARALMQKQCYESILYNLVKENYESQEFYDKYIDPSSHHVQLLDNRLPVV